MKSIDQIKHITLYAVLITSFLIFSGCNKSGGGGGETAPAPAANPQIAPTVTDWYQYSQDPGQTECTTNRHEFTNRADLCVALQDYQRNNNNCAWIQRLQRFVTDCPGQYFSITNYPNNTETTNNQSKYKYKFMSFDCDTGTHEYTTLPEFCTKILDNSLNKNCVEDYRRSLHGYYCKGL